MVVRNLWTGTVGSGVVFPTQSHRHNGTESEPTGALLFAPQCRHYLAQLFEPEEVTRLTDKEAVALVAD